MAKFSQISFNSIYVDTSAIFVINSQFPSFLYDHSCPMVFPEVCDSISFGSNMQLPFPGSFQN